MRFVIYLAFLCLSVSAFSQSVWVENVQFQRLFAAGMTIKATQVDGLNADIYLDDDILHVKVMPSKVTLDDEYANVLILGNLSMTSEKKRTYKYAVVITFDLTDGVIKHPCIFAPDSTPTYRFLNSDNLSQRLNFDNEAMTANEITLVKERNGLRGENINVPIKATWVNVSINRTLRSFRASSRASQIRNR